MGILCHQESVVSCSWFRSSGFKDSMACTKPQLNHCQFVCLSSPTFACMCDSGETRRHFVSWMEQLMNYTKLSYPCGPQWFYTSIFSLELEWSILIASVGNWCGSLFCFMPILLLKIILNHMMLRLNLGKDMGSWIHFISTLTRQLKPPHITHAKLLAYYQKQNVSNVVRGRYTRVHTHTHTRVCVGGWFGGGGGSTRDAQLLSTMSLISQSVRFMA